MLLLKGITRFIRFLDFMLIRNLYDEYKFFIPEILIEEFVEKVEMYTFT